MYTFRRKNQMLIALILVIILMLTACSDDTDKLKGQLKLGGSSTVELAAAPASESFMEKNPDVEISVRSGGSGTGVEGAATGGFHVGMASRNINQSELDRWPDLKATLVGRDGLAVVVNRSLYDAGVTQLTVEQVNGIYMGEITNWQEVGGPDAEIRAFDKELHRGARQVFGEFFLGGAEQPAPGAEGDLGDNDTVISTISQAEDAIAYVSIAWQTEDVVGVSIVLEDGTVAEPTIENVADGTYPVARDLNMITNGDPEGLAKEFIDFLLSAEGQAFFTEAGYVAIAG